MYKDAFTPYADQAPLLGASDVIKSITYIYPTAQAMVLSGPTQRFVVRGVERRKLSGDEEKFKCQWDKGACTAPALSTPSELAEHLLEHLSSTEPSAPHTYPCTWATCQQVTPSARHLRAHVLTHISRNQTVERHPSQSDTITVPGDQVGYPTLNPTNRPLPPPPKTWVVYERATMDPPSHCLTALLIIRLLFRTAFADVEAAPKADADHFGFPGVVEEEAEEVEVTDLESDREGARRGRRAFSNLHQAFQNFKLRDEALTGWVIEMIDAVSSEI
jgi:chromatin structure-remodeling complex subunit RSC9